MTISVSMICTACLQPASFLIDQEGIIVYQTYSVVDGDTVNAQILDLLEP
jgi:hypothetical protein